MWVSADQMKPLIHQRTQVFCSWQSLYQIRRMPQNLEASKKVRTCYGSIGLLDAAHRAP
jgi:hypothetical protein